jgi:hypothetical protein
VLLNGSYSDGDFRGCVGALNEVSRILGSIHVDLLPRRFQKIDLGNIGKPQHAKKDIGKLLPDRVGLSLKTVLIPPKQGEELTCLTGDQGSQISRRVKAFPVALAGEFLKIVLQSSNHVVGHYPLNLLVLCHSRISGSGFNLAPSGTQILLPFNCMYVSPSLKSDCILGLAFTLYSGVTVK